MAKVGDQDYNDFPVVAFFEDYGDSDSFFNTLRSIGWRKAAYSSKYDNCADFDDIMRFFIKIYALMIGMLTVFYLMAYIFLINGQQKLKDNVAIVPNSDLYFGTLIATITLGIAAYVLNKSRHCPFNVIFYIIFTFGIGYLVGYPLSMLLQEGYYAGQDWIILVYMYSMTIGCYLCLIIILIRRQDELNGYLMVLAVIIVMVFLLFVFIMTAPYYMGLLIVSFVCHVIHGCLIVIDTKLILAGKYSLKTNQYLSGAIFLYLDITIMMIYFVGCILYAIIKSKTKCLSYFCDAIEDD